MADGGAVDAAAAEALRAAELVRYRAHAIKSARSATVSVTNCAFSKYVAAYHGQEPVAALGNYPDIEQGQIFFAPMFWPVLVFLKDGISIQDYVMASPTSRPPALKGFIETGKALLPLRLTRSKDDGPHVEQLLKKLGVCYCGMISTLLDLHIRGETDAALLYQAVMPWIATANPLMDGVVKKMLEHMKQDDHRAHNLSEYPFTLAEAIKKINKGK